jgi:phenylalanyl-tRNA synthetase beta chain
MSVMRSSLLGSLLQVLKFNLDRKAERVRVFELGRVFLRDASVQTTDTTVRGVRQPMRVAGLAYGARTGCVGLASRQGGGLLRHQGRRRSAARAAAGRVFAPAEHPAMHPGRCASVSVDGKAIGFVGELHPRWRQGWDLAQAPCCSSWTSTRSCSARCPNSSRSASFQPWSATSPSSWPKA